jgi:hypothetical protein
MEMRYSLSVESYWVRDGGESSAPLCFSAINRIWKCDELKTGPLNMA